MHIKNKKHIMLLLLALAVIISGCNSENSKDNIEAPQDETDEEIKEDIDSNGKITLSMRNPKVLNPITNIDKSVDQTLNLLFEKLVRIDENDKVIPNIAKSWSVNEDGTVVDITLNDDIKWHDGNDVIADDIVFSIKSIQEAEESPYKSIVENIISYRALEDGKVRIVYKEGFSGYEYMLYFPVIPHHIENGDKNPVGTGPYEFKEWETNQHMILNANSNYHLGEPKIENITVLCTPKSEGDLYSFDQGIIDVVSTDIIDREKHTKNNKSNIYEYQTLYYDYLGLNFNKSIFDDKKTRQGLMNGLNREYLLEKHYLNHGVIADVPVSPQSWLYESESEIYDYDKKFAKNSLKDKDLEFDLLVSDDNSQRIKVSNSIRKMYENIGVKVNVVEADAEEFMNKVESGNYDMFIGGWEFSVIPDLSFAFHSSMISGGTNYINYDNEEMDNLLSKTVLAKDNKSLEKSYSKLQKNISKELPYLSLYFKTAALITDDKIKGDIKPHHLNIYNDIHNWYLIDTKDN